MKLFLKVLKTSVWSAMILGLALAAKAEDTDFIKNHYLLFVSNRDGNKEVYRLDPSSGMSINITNNAAEDDGPDWSPIRKKVAFVSNRNGSYDIFEMNLDGTNQQVLVGGEKHQVYPSYSNDGKRLAYCSNETGYWWIYIIDINSRAKTKLVSTPFASPPTWSPDDKRITFEGLKKSGSHQEIMVIDVDRSNERQLTNARGASVHPMFSPDGKQIAFCSKRDGKESIFIMNADGSKQTKITSRGFVLGRGIDLWPSWSPDGSSLTFYSTSEIPIGFLKPAKTERIVILNLDTKKQATIVKDHAGDSRPVWVKK